MTKSTEETIRDRIARKSGKDFQQLFWDILICHYPNLQTPKMLRDLGSDGHCLEKKEFFAVYTPESFEYDNKKTVDKINEDYEKFLKEWVETASFEKWIFVTKRNLKGEALREIAKLDQNEDGIRKINWGLEKIVKLALDLKEKDQKRIFILLESNIIRNIGVQLNNPRINGNVYQAGKMMFKNANDDECQPREVETIIDLIIYISNNTELQKGDLEDVMPDPEKKIYRRFTKYCKEINSEIVNSAMYAIAQKEAKKVVGLDKIRVGKITAYLKRESRRMLRENDNNPITALDKLTDHFADILKQGEKEYDRNAIRYYLIGEIPKCNVFPNENE
ncbi:MAG: hypothetical protein HQ541_18475 [Mariniphaga sp.]|nr:hypothetical protein [Mariniphaga sp.]